MTVIRIGDEAPKSLHPYSGGNIIVPVPLFLRSRKDLQVDILFLLGGGAGPSRGEQMGQFAPGPRGQGGLIK